MKFEILDTKDNLYDKCENMEQVYDHYYLPLLTEYQELKKQLEELEEQSASAINKQVSRGIDLTNQQKDFIEWLEDSVRTLEMLDKTFTLKNYKNEIRIYKEILSKYNETLGGSNG